MGTQIQSVFNNFMIETKTSFYYAQILTTSTSKEIYKIWQGFFKDLCFF